MNTLIKITFGLFVFIVSDCQIKNEKTKVKPNIIYFYTDQQSSNMMSCAGNDWLNTPAMDYIAQNGIRFTRAYVTNPVCSPSRVSMMTGRLPGYFKDDKGDRVKENVGSMNIPDISDSVKNSTLSAFLIKAGYNLFYGGKEHLPKSLTPEALGFTDISDDERDNLAYEAARFITSDPKEPYFLIISLINPHDICYMAIRDFASTEHDSILLQKGKTELATLDEALKIPSGVSEQEFYERYCPPLPPNFEPQENEPNAITWRINKRSFQKNAREQYTEKDWRRHRWAYCRLTETVDSQIQIVLDALKSSGQEENTLIMMSSDHGEMDGAHRLEHKSLPYEESINIPFLAMWKGQIPPNRTDSVHLISNGLDLLPTLCDYAGIEGFSDTRGMSLRPLFEGRQVEWRNNLGVESEVGKMVIDNEGYKYIRYDVAGIEENIIDLNIDPYEKTHFTDNPEYRSKLYELRSVFDNVWFPDSDQIQH